MLIIKARINARFGKEFEKNPERRPRGAGGLFRPPRRRLIGGGAPGAGGGGGGAATETAAQTAGKNHSAAGAEAFRLVAGVCIAVKAVQGELQKETFKSLKECTIAAAIAYPIVVEVSRGNITPAIGGGAFVALVKATQGEFSEGKALNSTVKVGADTLGFAAIVSAGPPGWVAVVLGGLWSWFVEKFVDKHVPQTPPTHPRRRVGGLEGSYGQLERGARFLQNQFPQNIPPYPQIPKLHIKLFNPYWLLHAMA